MRRKNSRKGVDADERGLRRHGRKTMETEWGSRKTSSGEMETEKAEKKSRCKRKRSEYG